MNKDLDKVNSDLILNSTRLLILLSKYETKKSFKMNINKIMLLDFYMKFPKTMISNEVIIKKKYDFNEYYSFYHWQPDRDLYNFFLRYLLSKRLIEKKIIKNDFIYFITRKGIETILSLKSDYSNQLHIIANYVKKNVSILSDEKIEETIIKKSFSEELIYDK
ncbi:ABC-three component system middle component 2 [Psychrobacillus psychrodurans]|uniref:ABC-three component system middle component 2 n=1 Tax=Psychrobacillus psychrodurans TaxID=126157 RepID=UPI003D02DD04